MTEEKNKSEEQSSEEEKKSDDKKQEQDATKDESTNDETSKDTKEDTSCDAGTCETEEKSSSVFLWVIIIVLIVGGLILWQQKKDSSNEPKPVNEQTQQEVSEAALNLINGQLVAPGTEVEIGTITEESGLYKIELTVAGQEITSYMTKDMDKFIPQLIEVSEVEEDNMDAAGEGSAPVTEVTNKSDKPEVELFVMSYCPYGTQIEKGILPVLDTLGNKVDAELKFVDYAMHGEKEVKENLRQYCIQENEPQKLNPYLKCFLASSEGSEAEAQACMTQVGVNQSLLNKCVADTDAEYKVTELAQDKSTYVSGQFPQFNVDKDDVEKYGVQGSPTLVINGEKVQSGRDSASLLTAICSAFNEPPAECETELSSASPAPGFGTETDATGGASAEAGCGA